jgi:hypothetical protein
MHTVTIAWFRAHLDQLGRQLELEHAVEHDERRFRGDTGAVSTELVIIIAGLAALALAVVAIIAFKVNDKANSIPTS